MVRKPMPSKEKLAASSAAVSDINKAHNTQISSNHVHSTLNSQISSPEPEAKSLYELELSKSLTRPATSLESSPPKNQAEFPNEPRSELRSPKAPSPKESSESPSARDTLLRPGTPARIRLWFRVQGYRGFEFIGFRDAN